MRRIDEYGRVNGDSKQLDNAHDDGEVAYFPNLVTRPHFLTVHVTAFWEGFTREDLLTRDLIASNTPSFKPA